MMQFGLQSYFKRYFATVKVNEGNHFECLKPEKDFPYHIQGQLTISNIQLSLQLLLISYALLFIVFILQRVKQFV